jgi:predicted RecB family nuclease
VNNVHKINTILGHAVHKAIESYVDSWRINSNIAPDIETLTVEAKNIVNGIWTNADTQIYEIINNIEINEGRDYQHEQINKISMMVVRFCRVWNDRGFQNMTYVAHETPLIHVYDNNIELSGEPDLIISDNNGLYYILDWKTGSSSKTSLGRSQLGIYSFLVHKVYSVAYSNIRCSFVSLKDSSSQIREFKNRDLRGLSERLLSIQDITNNFTQFPEEDWAAPNEQNCSNCNYTTPCNFSFD